MYKMNLFSVEFILDGGGVQNFWKKGVLLDLPRQNSFFSLVLSSEYIAGTAWLVKVGANESRIYPSYLTGVYLQ